MTTQSTPEDTIAAIATAPGVAAIQIIRISGTKAFDIQKKLFTYKFNKKKQPHTLYLGWIIKDKQKLDQALCVQMPTPNSYTGEDIVELHLHGSPVLTNQVLELCIQNGARLATPGEFTKRAFLSGKIDLTQAEAIGEIIQSSNVNTASLGTYQLAGALKIFIRSIKQQLIQLAAHYTATLDFSEEDIDSTNVKHDKKVIDSIQEKVAIKLTNADNLSSFKYGFNVSILGLPNAGKSTLLNTLLGFERAIVTKIAGTTRDTLAETLQLGDISVRFTDTAGLRKSSDVVEQLGIDRSVSAHQSSDLNLLLIEPGQAKQSYEYISISKPKLTIEPHNTLIVTTKQDTINTKNNEVARYFKGFKICKISAKENTGIIVLKKAIQSMLSTTQVTKNIQLLTARQVELLTKLSQELHSTSTSLQNNLPADIILVYLQSCITICNQITGEDTTQEIIDEVFSNFCIGK